MTYYYKVFTDFVNFISIDDTELEKAMRALSKGSGAIFNKGATTRVEVILPDNVKMMGWNTGYKPSPEELGEIERDRLCQGAQRLHGKIKEHLALSPQTPFLLEEFVSEPKRLASSGFHSLGEIAQSNYKDLDKTS